MSTTDGEPEPEIDDEESAAVLRAVGKIVKRFRERKGLTQAQLGKAIGYSEELVSSAERGRRAPKEQFLDATDDALDADGVISGLKEDVEQARYPKKVRDLAKLEARAVEVCAYDNSVINGLLQTPAYAKSLYEMHRPALSAEELERLTSARLARQKLLERNPGTVFSFALEEVTLHRPLGGRMVMREQLEHLSEIGKRQNVEIQVMPTDRDDHAGLNGSLRLLRLGNGDTVAPTEMQLTSRLISHPREVQILELRYGIIRAQALAPRESLAFIVTCLHRKVAGRDMMTAPSAGENSELQWYKSSYSTSDGPSCVEVATTPTTIRVRDSKDTALPHLAFAPQQWAAFLPYAARR